MADIMRPLTPEEQHKFDHERQGGGVVQHKCANCGTWWETMRMAEAFTETFDCDCGARLTFTVEALEVDKLTIPAGALDLSSPDARFDSGMKVSEAIKRASAWWDGPGRKLMTAKVREAGEVPQSAIVSGEPWDMLNREEKLQVVKAWHHFNVRVPDVIGTPEHEFSFTRPRPN